jgi:hypothetical protein
MFNGNLAPNTDVPAGAERILGFSEKAVSLPKI